MERTPFLLLIGLAIALIVVLWILLLPPFSVLRGGSCRQPAGNGYGVCALNRVPEAPVGLAPASRYYKVYAQKSGGAVAVSFPLADPKALNHGLSFYTFQSGHWKLLAPASVGADGVSAQGQLPSLPSNIIVFKRPAGALQVLGTLPAGKTLSAEAAKQITILNPAGFAPATDGSVTGEAASFQPSAQYQVIPAVQAREGQTASAVSQILQVPEKETAHVAALAALANRPGNTGVELDYTQVPVAQRQAFSSFVTTLAGQLHKSNHLLILELPAPTLTANGWDTGAYDWSTLAKNADYLKLVPNPDQSIYRKQIPDLLKYLTTQAGVDAHKIILVTSVSSMEKSSQGVHPLTRLSALSLASQIQAPSPNQALAGNTIPLVAANLSETSGASGLVWDTNSATVSFDYSVGDSSHIVWIANQFSEAFKLQYVSLYHLGGVAVDDASNDSAIGDLWPAIAAYAADGAPQLLQPNPQLLAPVWMVDGKPLDAGGKAAVQWAAPAQAGSHTASLIVSDGVIRVVGSLALNVLAAPPPGATPGPGGVVAGTATPRPAPPTAGAGQTQFGAASSPTRSP